MSFCTVFSLARITAERGVVSEQERQGGVLVASCQHSPHQALHHARVLVLVAAVVRRPSSSCSWWVAASRHTSSVHVSVQEDGIRFGVVDNVVNDSTSIVKVQRIDRSLELVTMDEFLHRQLCNA